MTAAQLTNLTAELARLTATVAELQGSLETTDRAVDESWILLSSVTIFFMQCGFGMLEAGAVRAKNTRNILMKNLLDTCFGTLVFWTIGWAIAWGGGNGVVGKPLPYEAESISGLWFHQYVYAAACTTIVSGAIAERTRTVAYVVHSTTTAGIIYPVVVHWMWNSVGWLSPANSDAFLGGAIDFAGSAVVHLTGGVVALVGAYVIGPRKERFNQHTGLPVAMPGHSSVLMALGCFCLWFGWIGFNIGSVLSIIADSRSPARVAVNTMLAGAVGGVTVLLVNLKWGTKAWSVEGTINGILSGLVSITAGCSTVESWAALVIGVIGGLIYFAASWAVRGPPRSPLPRPRATVCPPLRRPLLTHTPNLTIPSPSPARALPPPRPTLASRHSLPSRCLQVLRLLRVDDVLDAFAVHGACGLWGLWSTALFTTPELSYGGSAGVFYGGGKLMGAAAVGGLATTVWAAVTGFGVFYSLKKIGWLRVSAEAELIGVDHGSHGGSAYGYDAAEAPLPEYPPPYVEPPKRTRPACSAARSIEIVPPPSAVRRPEVS